jgi:hypothetical protein
MKYYLNILIILIFSNKVYSQLSEPIGTEVCYTYEEMKAELNRLANEYPAIVMLRDIGDSRGKEYYLQGYSNYAEYNHDILAVKVSDNVTNEEDEPSVYFMGLHHGDELASLEVTMEILKTLVENYSSDSKVKEYVDKYQIWFIPSINPNAQKVSQEITPFRSNIADKNNNKEIDVLELYYTLNDTSFLCLNANNIPQEIINELGLIKNQMFVSMDLLSAAITNTNNFPKTEPERTNMLNLISPCIQMVAVYDLDGLDLNRNYQYAKSDDDTNPVAWSEPEVRAVRSLVENHHFIAGISYHGYLGVVMRPYDYDISSQVMPPDVNAFNQIGNNIASNIEITNTPGLDYYQYLETFLYDAWGTSTDYGYGFHGIINFTVELENVSPKITQEERDKICQANIPAAYNLLSRLSYAMLTGHIKDEDTYQPIVAEIKIEGIDNFTDPNQKPIHKSDQQFGRYYRLLNPGNYNVTITADGYAAKTFQDVLISETNITELNVLMSKGYNWPLDNDHNPDNGINLSTQHTIIGQFADCRGNREYLNKGVEIKVPINKEVAVFAVQSGTAYLDSKAVNIGKFRYKNLKNIQVRPEQYVSAGSLIGYVDGDRLVFMENEEILQSRQEPTSKWINPVRKDGLTPYIDEIPPVINKVTMSKNGVYGDLKGRIFGKIDIIVDAYDPATKPDGSSDNNYKCGINKIVVQFFNSQGNEIDNSKIEYFIGFDSLPQCSTRDIYASGSNSASFYYIATNDPFNTPHDKYWNSRQRKGHDYSIDARYPGEAKFAEGGLSVKVTVYDYAGNSTEK